MLFAGPENDAPPVRLKLPAKGWHRIYVAAHYSDIPDSITVSQGSVIEGVYMLRLKLDTDPCYHVIFPERYITAKEGRWPEHEFGPYDLVEVFWRCADLDGGHVEFRPARVEEGYRQTAACVAYVRLAPMSDAQIAEAKRDAERRDTKRLMGVYDGAFWGHYPSSREQFREFVEPLRDSDFRTVAWSTSRADTVQYDSREFQVWESPPSRGVKPYFNARDIRRAIADGLDPLGVMAEICDEMGLELLGSMRIAAQHMPPHSRFCENPYLWSDPENRVRTGDGLATGHLSLASAKVRRRLTSVLREQVERYDIAGVHVMFNRSFPFVLYEEPARGEFIAEHGEDPVKLDPCDERWIVHKCRYVTGFIRQIRAMLDEVGDRKGKRLKLAVHAMSCPRHNRFFGLDLEHAIRAGWVDYVAPHPTFSIEIQQLEPPDEYGPNNTDHHSVTPERIAEWRQIAAGTNCLVLPDVFPRRKPADEFRKQAMAYYNAGADGLSFHDLYWRIHRKSEWTMLSRLGHRDELPGWQQRCEDYFRKRALISVLGLSMDPRYNPGSCG